jgi:hypothetical protein
MKRGELVSQRGMTGRDDIVIHIAITITHMACSAHACPREQIIRVNETVHRCCFALPIILVMRSDPTLGWSVTT